MSIGSRGAFNFASVGVKKIFGLIRSTDGSLIEPAKCFIDGGDHINCGDSTHMYGHEGHIYEVGYYNASVSAGANLDILLVTGNTLDAHMTWEVSTGGGHTFGIYEFAAATATPGTGLTERCIARGISGGDAAAAVSASHTPTGLPTLNDANRLGPLWPSAGSGVGASAGGIKAGTRDEWILKPSAQYLIQVTNTESTTKFAAVRIRWYDHDAITAKDQV